ncbi:BZ3500_MvSof-1268-A1-R1_Chr1-1g00981 [Microbotryum saponariae]|uniref:BZ3500_MvSof-1268-A1-R1_Chr1-1g00981 protein n=1 Tax=Microbotryum saponariae TaxID=289078 RepID=A0A2X0KSH9_9BASI|nr:BZ3500_MvSof-1268-A1-R1_Chr1-1g00981 [Microbotryum saponariae]SCZ93093.1 BZ3501_MvSof-1269-A2-R1_Chr1-1g00578 [Microbotryum saponariae]
MGPSKKARIDHNRPDKIEQWFHACADTAPELDELNRLVRHFAGTAPGVDSLGGDHDVRQQSNDDRGVRSLQSSQALSDVVGQQLEQAECLLHTLQLRLAPAQQRARDVNSEGDTRPEAQAERGTLASWQDRIDAIGVMLWNKVTEIKTMATSGTQYTSEISPRIALQIKPDVSSDSLPLQWLSMIARGMFALHAWYEQNIAETNLSIIARHLAYLLIQLGTPEPISSEGRVLLLSLLNKTIAESLSTKGEQIQLSRLFDAAATYAQEIHAPAVAPPSRPDTTPDDVRALSGHYVQRIVFESRRSAFGVADFIKHRLESLIPIALAPLELDELTSTFAYQQVEKIAHGALDSAREVLAIENSSSAALQDKAKEWLLWSIKLAEGMRSESARAIKIASLSLLTQIHTRTQSWREAEEVVAQLLTIEATPSMWLRKIRLMMERDAGEGELGQAFGQATTAIVTWWNEGDLEKNSVRRRPDFAMFKEIVTNLCSPADEATSRIIRQIAMTVTVHSRSDDRTSVTSLFQNISTRELPLCLPLSGCCKKRANRFALVLTDLSEAFTLSADYAFVATTYFWRHGDQERAKGAFFEAAEWYRLSLHPLLKETGGVVDAKSMRKAVLCYLEIRDFVRAEQTMNLRPDRPPDAKDCFIRFFHATLKQDVDKATQALDKMIKAPDFQYVLLLWASKVANESGITALSTAVLQALLDVYRRGEEGSTQNEMLTTVRSLIRLLASRLESEADSGLSLARLITSEFVAATDIVRESFGKHLPTVDKDITWLLKTGYNICATYSSRWPAEVITPMYEAVARLGDLKLESGSVDDPKLKRSIVFCRVATLSGLLAQARSATSASDQSKLYSKLLRDTQELAQSVPSLSEKSDDVATSALLAFEVEARSGLCDWGNVEALFSVSPDGRRRLDSTEFSLIRQQRLASAKEPTVSLSAIKLITARAVVAADCAPDVLGSILEKTLHTLFYRKDLDSPTLGAWLRVMISSLLASAPGQALTYVKHALTFVKTLTGYPRDEVQWLVATTWDRGLDLFSVRDLEPAEEWCQLAVELAQCIDENQTAMLSRSLEQLRTRMRAFASTDSDLG